MLVLACILAAAATAAAAPATYDQRQDGELNVRADVQNVVFLVAVPQNMIHGLFKSAKHHELRERADTVMEAFVEPSTPYRVEIGSDRSAEGDGRAVEVVIAGRRRLGSELQAEEPEEEIKLLGAMENCGPERERDPVTLSCRFRSQPEPSPAKPEPSPAKPDPSPAKPEPSPTQPENIKELATQAIPEVVPAAS